METITALRLRQILNMVPDNTPIYVVGESGGNKCINNVTFEIDKDTNYRKFIVKIDYEL